MEFTLAHKLQAERREGDLPNDQVIQSLTYTVHISPRCLYFLPLSLFKSYFIRLQSEGKSQV